MQCLAAACGSASSSMAIASGTTRSCSQPHARDGQASRRSILAPVWVLRGSHSPFGSRASVLPWLKRIRVLMIEGTPRYEFRYIKTFFERESDKADSGELHR